MRNFCVIIARDPFFGNIFFDTMRAQPCRVYEDGRRDYWTDDDDAAARVYVENSYGLRSPAKLDDAFKDFLAQRRFSPVQELIKSFNWDGKYHCQRFLQRCLLTGESDYTAEVSRILFRQMIARAFDPGCKADYVPVLQGKQGVGKSTVCRWLALEDDFFSELTDISGHRGFEAISGKFVCELPELIATAGEGSRKDNMVKAFVSGQSDHYRRPYDRRATDNPRSCVFVGTTNQKRFLSDPTGNRRWLPVECRLEDASLIFNHEQEIRREIAQSLAEMYNAYVNHLSLAAPAISPALIKTVTAHQEASEMEDYRVGLIQDYVLHKKFEAGKEYVCIAELWRSLNNRREMTRTDANEIGELLRHKLGCQSLGKKHFRYFGTQHAYSVSKITKIDER